MDPFISVIVTAYQYRPYIVEALESVANQDLDKEKYEVIVVANYDESQISKYLRSNWKFIQSKNRWIGAKVFNALKESSGEVIVFLEDDDLFESHKLRTIYNIFREKPKLGFYRHKVRIINEYGTEATLPKSLFDSQKILIHKQQCDLKASYLMVFKNRGGYASVSSIAMRRELLEQYSNYLRQIRLAIDSFYLIISFLSEYDMLFDNIILGKYRLQKQSASSYLIDFNNFINNYFFKYLNLCKDHQINYWLAKGSDIEEFTFFDYVFSKIMFKLFITPTSKKNYCYDECCKMSFYEILRILDNPYAEDTLKTFVLGIATYLPFKLRKIILRKIYDYRLNMYNKLFNHKA